jgi:hypothetical protein
VDRRRGRRRRLADRHELRLEPVSDPNHPAHRQPGRDTDAADTNAADTDAALDTDTAAYGDTDRRDHAGTGSDAVADPASHRDPRARDHAGAAADPVRDLEAR